MAIKSKKRSPIKTRNLKTHGEKSITSTDHVAPAHSTDPGPLYTESSKSNELYGVTQHDFTILLQNLIEMQQRTLTVLENIQEQLTTTGSQNIENHKNVIA